MGYNADGVMAIPRKPLDQITSRTGIEFSSHNLRRIFATIANASLLPETIIKRLLNHATDNSVTGGGFARNQTPLSRLLIVLQALLMNM